MDPTRREADNYNYGQGDPINNSDPTGASILGGIAELTRAVGYAVVSGTAIGVGCALTTGIACVTGIGEGVAAIGSGLKSVNDADKEFNG